MKTLDDLLRPIVRRASVLELRKEAAPQSVVTSKFGGIPYHEAGESWPTCPTCEKSLAFICQIDVRQTPHPARTEIPFFTFFYCWGCFPYGDPNEAEGQWVVRVYRDPQGHKAIQIPPPPSVEHAASCRVSFTERLSLPNWEGADRWCPEATEFARQANSESPWGAYREATTRMVGEQEITTCVGGYPRWIQGESTPKGTEFLAQIDTENEADIMWGDVGSVYLFFSTTSPTDIRMTLQCC